MSTCRLVVRAAKTMLDAYVGASLRLRPGITPLYTALGSAKMLRHYLSRAAFPFVAQMGPF